MEKFLKLSSLSSFVCIMEVIPLPTTSGRCAARTHDVWHSVGAQPASAALWVLGLPRPGCQEMLLPPVLSPLLVSTCLTVPCPPEPCRNLGLTVAALEGGR